MPTPGEGGEENRTETQGSQLILELDSLPSGASAKLPHQSPGLEFDTHCHSLESGDNDTRRPWPASILRQVAKSSHQRWAAPPQNEIRAQEGTQQSFPGPGSCAQALPASLPDRRG